MVDMGQPNARFGGGGVTPNGQMDQTQINPRIVVTSHYKFQLLLTSYEIFASDAEILVPIPWQFVVVDEAHRLKNRLSKTLQLLRQVACRHTLVGFFVLRLLRNKNFNHASLASDVAFSIEFYFASLTDFCCVVFM